MAVMNTGIVIFLAAFAVFILICLISMITDVRRFVVRHYTVRSAKVSKPLTFVFVTDLHSKCFGNEQEPLVTAIERENPDAVLAGGDLIVSREAGAKKPGWQDAALLLLQKLAAKYPIFLANGNHEGKLVDPEEGDFALLYQDYMKKVETLGVRTLHNESVSFEGITITGLELPQSSYQKIIPHDIGGDAVETCVGVPKDNDFQLMLAHNPKFFRHYAAWGADLTLSGHVHGGLMRLGLRGAIAPDLHLFPRYSFGAYRIKKGDARGDRWRVAHGTEGCILPKDQAAMIVSCGLGSHTLPIRIFNPGELSVIHLEPEK